MAATSLKYYLRVPEGKGKHKAWVEYGPVEQDILMQWAKTGRVTRDSEIRNALVPGWTPVEDVSFLKTLIIDPVEEARSKKTWKDKFYDKLVRSEQQSKRAIGGLHKAGRFKYDPAGPVERLLAWLIDITIIGGGGALMLLASSFLVQKKIADQDTVFAGVTGLTLFAYIWYFTIRVAFRAQTVGQWFWGIMLVRTDGEPVLAARALSFTFWHMLLGVLTLPCTVFMPAKRSIQDLLSGVRVVSIKVRQDQ